MLRMKRPLRPTPEQVRQAWQRVRPALHIGLGLLLLLSVVVGFFYLLDTASEAGRQVSQDKKEARQIKYKYQAAEKKVVQLDTARQRYRRQARAYHRELTRIVTQRDSVTTAYHEEQLALDRLSAQQLERALADYRRLELAPLDTVALK